MSFAVGQNDTYDIHRLTFDFIGRGRESVASFSTCVYPMESIVIALMSLSVFCIVCKDFIELSTW